MKALSGILLLCVCVAASIRRFDQDVVLRLSWNNSNPAHTRLYDVFNNMNRDEVEFWSPRDLYVAAQGTKSIYSVLNAYEVPFDVFIDDVQVLVNRERDYSRRLRPRKARTNVPLRHQAKAFNVKAGPDSDPFFDDYRNFADINSWVDQVAANYSELVVVTQLNTTYEGRPIRVVKITSGKHGVKPVIFWEGGIHAREWITHATMCYIISTLTSGYATDPTVKSILDNYEIHIVPIVNGDGYVYTWTNDRMWRKTRSPNERSPCIGTDPNRNWDDHWCVIGASTNACSDSYCGVSAFSEREVQTVANHILATQIAGQRVLNFIDWHAYGQLYMGPYGWSGEAPPDAQVQLDLGTGNTLAIEKVNGLIYQYGRIYVIIYPASGSSADWGYDVAKVVYSYGVELRDTGTYGFLLPANQIRPQGAEIWATLVNTAQYLLLN